MPIDWADTTVWGPGVRVGDPVISGGKRVGWVTAAEAQGTLFTVTLDDPEYLTKDDTELRDLSMVLGCGDQA